MSIIVSTLLGFFFPSLIFSGGAKFEAKSDHHPKKSTNRNETPSRSELSDRLGGPKFGMTNDWGPGAFRSKVRMLKKSQGWLNIAKKTSSLVA